MASTASHRVFGMNRRNRELVMRLNPAHAIDLANDKIASKRALERHGIPTPRLIADLHRAVDINAFVSMLRKLPEGFVIKPARGAQGRGVNIFTHVLEDGTFLPISGDPMPKSDFRHLIASILSGEFTSGRPQDSVLVEQRIHPDGDWVMAGLSGPPDLRILVMEGRALMAMVRMPTIRSGGRANLHRGAVGAGVDLETGRTTTAVWGGKAVEFHPDTGETLRGCLIQGFDRCIEIAQACHPATGLGYIGVDVMLDSHSGPSILEVNARPGLAIQVANRTGLGTALARLGRKSQ